MTMTREALRHLAKIGGTLRTGEVAEVLDTPAADVRRLARLSNGLKPAPGPGSQRRWNARDVENWLMAHPDGNPFRGSAEHTPDNR